jgi:SAM-dependent methyltransferase
MQLNKESGHPRIAYFPYWDCWRLHDERLHRLIEESGAKRICDVGGGANPAVGAEQIEHLGLEYVLLDVSESELEKAPDVYTKVVADICAEPLQVQDEFDLVVTRMVAEHVADPVGFHRNVRALLSPNGRAFHFFPTLYALPFVLNRALPTSVSDRILNVIQSGRDESGIHGKFHVYYRWCRGPSKRQIARLESVGYVVEEYVGFMGHAYLSRLPPLQAVIDFSTELAVKWPVAALTSYSWAILRRSSGLTESDPTPIPHVG